MAKTPEQPKMKRRQQFVETFKMARRGDPRLIWWLLGAFVVGAAVGFALFWLLPGGGVLGMVSSAVGALMMGLLAALIMFSRRAQAAAYAQLEGRPGRRRVGADHPASRLEVRARRRLQQAAGRRAPRGRAPRHRAGR